MPNIKNTQIHMQLPKQELELNISIILKLKKVSK